ncbi:MAG TPA: TonB-dependent receptor plug domain-containing protein, partial [Gammaproteobacteria bacterium]|nr:TonB-dependent receptor plug domain-containing protein [Gammaproteobacteria bacterium]
MRYALSAGVAASFIGAPQMAAAQDDEDVADQGLITVTGSRIQRVDIEGPSPVAVISREDIEATGDISVAEVLRGSTFNQFGSFKTRSGSSAQSSSTVSLRGLGSTRTLVLLDGRRISGAPNFGAGSAQNLNTIPIAAVERIEVLRDGASAIYGSDAIGGVINVILRKDYEGLQLNGHVGRPTNSGGDEDSYGLVGGISSGKGNITFSLDHEERDIIFNGD